MKFRYYLDLDGCFTDFWGHFEDKFGIQPVEFRKNNTYEEYLNLIESGGTEFWAEMKWMPDGEDWWKHMSQYKDDIKIISYPLNQASCIPGKLEWVVTHLGLAEEHCIFNQNKAKYCEKWNDLLIDDTCSNLLTWRQAGGMAIQHTSTQTSIDILKALHDIPGTETLPDKVQQLTKSNDSAEEVVKENKETTS